MDTVRFWLESYTLLSADSTQRRTDQIDSIFNELDRMLRRIFGDRDRRALLARAGQAGYGSIACRPQGDMHSRRILLEHRAGHRLCY
jgi:hypothetical protein